MQNKTAQAAVYLYVFDPVAFGCAGYQSLRDFSGDASAKMFLFP